MAIGQIAGDQMFTRKCHALLEQRLIQRRHRGIDVHVPARRVLGRGVVRDDELRVGPALVGHLEECNDTNGDVAAGKGRRAEQHECVEWVAVR